MCLVTSGTGIDAQPVQLPSRDSSAPKIGKSVVYDELIDTPPSSQVQVLLLDELTFTVGHGSSLVMAEQSAGQKFSGDLGASVGNRLSDWPTHVAE